MAAVYINILYAVYKHCRFHYYMLIGEIVNIKDAYKHPKFFKDIDKTTGFHTRSAYRSTY